MEIKIPKEVRQHKETIFFGLSARQFFCAIAAVGLAVGVYLGLGPVIGKETASWLCILAAAPVALAGFFNYNGMTLEQFAWAFLKSEFLCAGERRFISKNIYYEMLKRKGAEDFD
ncbi:MAG: PrgI family protein [Clostridia bacterium]|nr:PrgI family protein [Clostridia bacterium]